MRENMYVRARYLFNLYIIELEIGKQTNMLLIDEYMNVTIM